MDKSEDTYRGVLFRDYLEEFFSDLTSLTVLDVGCRDGAFTLPLGRECKEVIGIDVDRDFVKKTKIKASTYKNVTIEYGNILQTKYKSNYFDLVILEGVLEWVGNSRKDISPIECQRIALKECRRILKPNGIIYIGIENRLCPAFWLKDPHTKTPLTVILPRFLSKPLYKLLKGKYYGMSLMSYWGYERLINEIFPNQCRIRIPIPHYKYLYEVSTFNRREFGNKLEKVSEIGRAVRDYKWWLRGLKMARATYTTKLILPNFVIIARKY